MCRKITLAFFVSGLGWASAQTTPPKTMLSVEGYAGQAPVVQINGKSYVEIDALAKATNGTVSFQANHITLALPAPDAASAPAQPAPKLSKDFIRALIDQMSVLGEWRSGIATAIQSNAQITVEWADGYKRNAGTRLELASTRATTEPDKSLLQLLRTESANIQALSDKYVALRKNQSFIEQDALENDPLNQQIEACARGLSAVAASGQFTDVIACH